METRAEKRENRVVPSGSNISELNDRPYQQDAEAVEGMILRSQDGMFEAGEFVAKAYYKDSPAEFSERRTKDSSVRKLSRALRSRGNVKLSKSNLHNAVAVYFQTVALARQGSEAKRLPFSAYVEILRLQNESQKLEILKAAIDEKMSVRDVRKKVRALIPTDETKHKRPAQLIKQALKRLFAQAETCAFLPDENKEWEAVVDMTGNFHNRLVERLTKIENSMTVQTSGHQSVETQR